MAEDLVVSGIRIETDDLLSGGQRVERALSQMEASTAQLEKRLARANQRLAESSRVTTSLASAHNTAAAASTKAANRAEKLGAAYERAKQEARELFNAPAGDAGAATRAAEQAEKLGRSFERAQQEALELAQVEQTMGRQAATAAAQQATLQGRVDALATSLARSGGAAAAAAQGSNVLATSATAAAPALESVARAERRVFDEALRTTGSMQKAAAALDAWRARGGQSAATADHVAAATGRVGSMAGQAAAMQQKQAAASSQVAAANKQAIATANKVADANNKVASTGSAAARSFRLQEGAAGGLARRITALAGAYIGVFAAIRLGRAFFRVNAELQDLQANLATVTGSAGAAAAAFRDITDFARTTPFEIKGLTEAFVRLQAFGAGPTIEQFRGLGNVSAAFSKDITTLTDAIVSAVNTSTEPIRAFGVQASIAGDKMKVSFNGVTTEIPRTTKALTEFIATGGNTGTMAGAMERRMDTLGGATSNLADVVTLLAKDIGEQGLNAEIIETIRLLTQATEDSDSLAVSIGQGAAGGVRLFREAIRLALPLMNTFSNLLASIGDQAGRVATPELAAIAGIEDLDVLERRRSILNNQLQEERKILDRMNEQTAGGLTGLGRRLLLQGDHEELAAQTAEVEGLIEALNAVDRKRRELNEIAQTPPTPQPQLLGLGDSAKKAKKEIDPVAQALERLQEELRGIAALRDALEGTGIPFDANAEAAKAYESALESVARVEGASAELVAELAGNYVGLERAVRRAEAAEAQRDNQMKVRRANIEKHQEFLREVTRRQNDMADELAREELARQREVAESITGSFADAFASVITGTESVSEAFRKMAQEIIAQLVRIQIQKAIIEPLMAQLFPSPTPGPIDLGGPGGGLGEFASGGVPPVGKPAIVGERGPELFIPQTLGRIIPNHELRAQDTSRSRVDPETFNVTLPEIDIKSPRDRTPKRPAESPVARAIGIDIEAIRERLLPPERGATPDMRERERGMFGIRPEMLKLDLPHFAAGGPISAAQPAIVGERGPELFVPKSDGSIVPNNQLREGGREPAPEIHIHSTFEIKAIDSRDAGQFFSQNAGSIAQEISREVERSSALRKRWKR